jgi:hypothetical protein
MKVSGVSVQCGLWPDKVYPPKEGGQYDLKRNFDPVKFPKK